MDQTSNRPVAKVSAYVFFPLGLGLLCAACTQGPHEQGDSPLFGATPASDRGALGADEGKDNQGDGSAPRDGKYASGDTDGGDSVNRAEAGTGLKDDDEDGIPDKYETLTGIFVDSSNTGTDPTKRDTDGDRLSDGDESGTGTFVSKRDTGSNPNKIDTDEDGLSDGDEVLGTEKGLDLPAFKVSPVHRDLLLEYDWIDDSGNGVNDKCPFHSHRPSAKLLEPITTAFANAPVENPDRKSGIHVVHDYGQDGQGGLLSGGNLLKDVPTMIEGTVYTKPFTDYMAASFNANRVGYFHYALMGHAFEATIDGTKYTGRSGVAHLPGTALMVTLGCDHSEVKIRNTIMHELGHNLGLQHGGDTPVNGKPNYNSVMSYFYQFPGVDTDCEHGGDGLPGYSRGLLAPLNEESLSEPAGICNNVPWDWNKSGEIDQAPVAFDINEDENYPDPMVLTDFNDWKAITTSKALAEVRNRFVDTSEPPVCPAPPAENVVDEDNDDNVDGSDGSDETGGTDDTGGPGEPGDTDDTGGPGEPGDTDDTGGPGEPGGADEY